VTFYAVQTFKDCKNGLIEDPVLVSLDQARSAIANRIRDIGNFNKHIIWKSDRRIGPIPVQMAEKTQQIFIVGFAFFFLLALRFINFATASVKLLYGGRKKLSRTSFSVLLYFLVVRNRDFHHFHVQN